MKPLITAALFLLASLSQAQTPHVPVFPVARHAIEYTDVPTSSGPTLNCERNVPPEGLSTPNPIVNQSGTATLSVIIGWDGRVYSAFVLSNNGLSNKQLVDMVATWRFRPASCNGAATTVEATVKFKS